MRGSEIELRSVLDARDARSILLIRGGHRVLEVYALIYGSAREGLRRDVRWLLKTWLHGRNYGMPAHIVEMAFGMTAAALNLPSEPR